MRLIDRLYTYRPIATAVGLHLKGLPAYATVKTYQIKIAGTAAKYFRIPESVIERLVCTIFPGPKSFTGLTTAAGAEGNQICPISKTPAARRGASVI